MGNSARRVAACAGAIALVAVVLASCAESGDQAGRDDPQEVFERIESDLGLVRPSAGVAEYYGELYARGGEGRDVGLWTLPDQSGVLPVATIFVLDEPDAFSPDDTENLAHDAAGVWSQAGEPTATRSGDLWIENAGPNQEGATVAVHRGLAYVIIGSSQVGARVLEAVRS